MVPKWCFGVDSDTHKHKAHRHTHTDSLFSLLTLHHHANPACFTRQETERLIVIPQGSADLSQICLCLSPHSTSFLYCLAPRNQKISHLWDLLEMWEICEWSPLPRGFLTRAARKSEGKAEQRWRGRQKEEGFTLFCAPQGYKAKAVLILRENAWPSWVWFFAQLLCVTGGGLKTVAGYLLEGSMCLSLNDQSSSISDVLSLPVYHTERRAALICFRRQYSTQYCLYSCSLFRWHPLFS